MRLLVLGGGWFVGRALVDEAVRAGHEVTVFNRGRSMPAQGAQTIHGDRANLVDLARLAGHGPWDAVVDVHGVIPAQVRDAARTLRRQTARYVLVSTVSAYRDWPASPITEDSPLHDGDPDADPAGWTWGSGVYGPLKAGSEAAVAREYPAGRTVIVRPGVILGPGEYGGRLTWWLNRAARGGQILAPGTPADPVRPVDVRDLARFLLRLLDDGRAGVFNVAGPARRDTFGSLIEDCMEVTGSAGTPVWVDSRWLITHGVKQWTELPMWRTAPGTWAIETTRAEKAGLVCRPLRETVADTWAWLEADGHPVYDDRAASHGIDGQREQDLLSAWAATSRVEAPEP